MLLALCLSLIGLFLVYLEFFFPGGLIAILGGLLITAGITYFSTLEIALSFKIFFFVATVGATALCCKLALWFIKNRQKDNLFLATDQENFMAATFDKNLIGKIGKAASDLKPSGHILIGEKRLQAVSEGEYIPKGTKILISGGRGAYFIVKETQ